MKRALTYDNLISQKFDLIPFEGEWQSAFGKPAYGGVWFIWGDSGSGKSSFVMQLMRQFCLFEKTVLYNALEEYQTKSFNNRLSRFNMGEVKKYWKVINEQPDALNVRLGKKRRADILIIDSIQYFRISKAKLLKFFEDHKDITLIVVSQSESGKERGGIATDAHFAGYMKIYVDKHVAYFKGREEVPKDGGVFVSYPEMAEKLGFKKTT